MAETEENAFTKEARKAPKGAAAEFLAFVFNNKKWWLAPIVVALVVVAILAVLGGSGVAPFIYSLF